MALVSVQDISVKAGVGLSTVYRTLRNHPNISEKARASVMTAIQELGYPHVQPRGDKRRRGGLTLWLPGISPSLATAFVSEVVNALEAALAERGRGLKIISQAFAKPPSDFPLELLREKCEGVLTAMLYNDSRLEALGRRWPVVNLLSARQIPGVICIMPNYADGARQAVEHLVSMGHCRMALIAGKVNERNFSRLFLDGYVGAMTMAGLGVSPELIDTGSDNLGADKSPDSTSGRRATRELLALKDPPTAIIARHDSLRGIMKALEELGLRVPRDVSVVACGALGVAEALAPTIPRLTTVSFSAERMARLALKMIKAVPPEGAQVFVPMELREGESVGRL